MVHGEALSDSFSTLLFAVGYSLLHGDAGKGELNNYAKIFHCYFVIKALLLVQRTIIVCNSIPLYNQVRDVNII